MSEVIVIGAGAWGTALAHVAASAGNHVILFGRDESIIAGINTAHRHPALGDASLHPGIRAQSRRPDFASADLAIFAVPAQKSRAALEAVGAAPLAGKPVILAAKGLEEGTGLRQSEILAALSPAALPLVLSGPSFAVDVARSKPVAVTLAANDLRLADRVAALLAGPTFRPYAAGDPLGVELAGALKNVFAIACGAVEGAGLGLSARASVIARAFAEETRIVTALGGGAATLAGLAGLGDLTLSCTTRQSRNYDLGFRLGARAPAAPALTEGVHTAPVARELARRAGVEAPIIAAVDDLLAGRAGIGELVAALMARPLKREGED